MFIGRTFRNFPTRHLEAGMSMMNQLLKAIDFAAIKHKDQRRKDPQQTRRILYWLEAYINHPIGVAFILSNEGDVSDLSILQAAVLHDTIEDTETTFQEIEKHFGPHVAAIVQECTDDKQKSKNERKEQQVQSAPSKSIQVGAI